MVNEIISGYEIDGTTLEVVSGNRIQLNLANANTYTATQTFPSASITNAMLAGNLVDSITATNGLSVTNPTGVGAASYTIVLNGVSLSNGTSGISLNLANANTWTSIQTFSDITATGITTTAGITDSVSITTPIIKSIAAQTTITGTTAGSIIASMPEQGGSYKKVVLYASGYENDTTASQTYTYPTAFSAISSVVYNNTGLSTTALSTSLTALTIDPDSTTIFTGMIVVEGY